MKFVVAVLTLRFLFAKARKGETAPKPKTNDVADNAKDPAAFRLR